MNYTIQKITLMFNNKHVNASLYIPKIKSTNRIVIICHGNYPAGKDEPFIVSLTQEIVSNGFIVLIFDNLGYNDHALISKILPEEYDLRWGAFAAITYIVKRFGKNSKITLLGHSMGASIALAVGSVDNRIDNIISISPTRVSRFIFNNDDLTTFWESNIKHRLKINIDTNTTRIVRSTLIEENYINFLKNKNVLLVYGRRERFFNYENWIIDYKKMIGNTCKIIDIPLAGHYFGVVPDKDNKRVFLSLTNELLSWLNGVV